jgi:hypothetical protein
MSTDNVPMKRPQNWLLVMIHILLWEVLAVAAYATAGPFKTASCWHIVFFYVPPATILLFAIAGFSLMVLLLSIVHPATRTTLSYSVAIHGMIPTAGMFGCNRIAYAATGQVSCL